MGREGTLPGFVRDAHSLYFETLAELGIPGLALLLAALGSVFVVGIGKLRRAEAYERALLAAALAAAAAFVTAAAIDWVWEMTVIPVAFLLLAAAVLRTSAGGRRRPEGKTGRSVKARIALAALALVSLVVIAMPMLAVRDVRQSQADAAARATGQRPGRRPERRALRGVRRHSHPSARPGPRGPGQPGGSRRRRAGRHPRGIDQLAHLAHPVPDRDRARAARRPPSTPTAPRARSTPARPCSQARRRRGTIMRSQMPDPERDEILDPKLPPAERERLLETARLLEQARPVPRPAFRGTLARQLRARSSRPPAPATADRRLRRLGPGPARGGGGRAGRRRAPGSG